MTESKPSTSITGYSSITRWIQRFSAKPENAVAGAPEPIVYDQKRNAYLHPRETIILGLATTLFLALALTAELLPFLPDILWQRIVILALTLPPLLFIALHVIVFGVAFFLNLIIKKEDHDHLAIGQGAIILGLLTVYSVTHLWSHEQSWFDVVAWTWLAILALDMVGDIAEKIFKPR